MAVHASGRTRCILAWMLGGIVVSSSCSSPVAKDGKRPQDSAASPGRNVPQDESTARSADAAEPATPETEPSDEEARYVEARQRMVAEQLTARDIRSPHVLEAMGRVRRHLFVPEAMRPLAYDDSPLPIGQGQTISQPYIVALMTQLVAPRAHAKALDIGTGSGYQAAILAEIVGRVFSIEIVEPLATEARDRLTRLGYQNIEVRAGDGYRGWPEEAPFDIIIVAAAPDHVPRPLEEQLAPGGKMVIPVGQYFQELLLIEKSPEGVLSRRNIAPVAFVPMTGEARQDP